MSYRDCWHWVMSLPFSGASWIIYHRNCVLSAEVWCLPEWSWHGGHHQPWRLWEAQAWVESKSPFPENQVQRITIPGALKRSICLVPPWCWYLDLKRLFEMYPEWNDQGWNADCRNEWMSIDPWISVHIAAACRLMTRKAWQHLGVWGRSKLFEQESHDSQSEQWDIMSSPV